PPEREDEPFISHLILLQQNGIYILETMNTGALVRDEAHEFLFVLGQPKVRGAVQMFINPIAIR
ncbi:MAG: cyclase family protein, partial [Gammaproteobacteria bacterium]|nr:cyclase family protein [Gammaproteobacteria bacterium]